MVAAIHSHTAPSVLQFRGWGPPDPEYSRYLGRQIAGAAGAAVRRLTPVRLAMGRTEHTALAWNRTGRAEVDPTVDVLRLDRESGGPLAVLVHYACHPVILGPKQQISADYPGAMRRFLKEQYPGAAIMFLNGACGDIDPVTNKTVWGQGSFEDVEHAGRALGEAVMAVSWSSAPASETRLRVAQRTVSLDLNAPTPDFVSDQIRTLRAKLQASSPEHAPFGAPSEPVEMPAFWLDYYEELAERQRMGEVPTVETAELQAFFLSDDVVLVGIPAEVYTAEGLAIRQRSPFAHTIVVCYANGLVGYVPPPEEYEKGSYAALLAAAVYNRVPFQADVSVKLVNAVVDLVAHG